MSIKSFLTTACADEDSIEGEDIQTESRESRDDRESRESAPMVATQRAAATKSYTKSDTVSNSESYTKSNTKSYVVSNSVSQKSQGEYILTDIIKSLQIPIRVVYGYELLLNSHRLENLNILTFLKTKLISHWPI